MVVVKVMFMLLKLMLNTLLTKVWLELRQEKVYV